MGGCKVTIHITWHDLTIQKEDRNRLNGHRGAVVWLTGLSGSGKSTIANALDYQLYQRNIRSYVLDGDNIRHGLNKDLGFSEKDRVENIRRIGEVAKLFVDSGQIVVTAFISPFQRDRDIVRTLFSEEEFYEVYVKCPLETCEARDPKGLYEKARSGEIKQFTGIDSPYEAPEEPELVVATDKLTVEESTRKIIRYLSERKIIRL